MRRLTFALLAPTLAACAVAVVIPQLGEADKSNGQSIERVSASPPVPVVSEGTARQATIDLTRVACAHEEGCKSFKVPLHCEPDAKGIVYCRMAFVYDTGDVCWGVVAIQRSAKGHLDYGFSKPVCEDAPAPLVS